MNYSERIIVYDTFLNTRRSARDVRTKLVEQIAKNNVVMLDIYKAEAISFAYTDELLGTLLLFLGKEKFKKFITIRAKLDIIKQIEEILKQKEEEAQVFCVCRDVGEQQIFRLLQQSFTPEQIKETTGAGTGCMWCMEKLESLYADFVKIPHENIS